MKRNEGACLVCGKPLVYFETARELECAVCHERFESYVSCVDGHFVCDRCHGEQGIRSLISRCRESGSRNPIALLQELMEIPGVHMHGPEHHVMVGAALLTAYRNSGGKLDLEAALQKMKERGAKYPGRLLRLLGLLRRCCERGHVFERRNGDHAAFREVLGALQPDNRRGARGDRGAWRPALLQAEFVYGGACRRALCGGAPRRCNGAFRCGSLHAFPGKQAVPENALPVLWGMRGKRGRQSL